VDYWDQDSAKALYVYLVYKLNVSPEKAKFLAEAAANKDSELKGYSELVLDRNNFPLEWKPSASSRCQPKTFTKN